MCACAQQPQIAHPRRQQLNLVLSGTYLLPPHHSSLTLLCTTGCEARGWLANAGKEDKTTSSRHTRLVLAQLKHARALKQSWESHMHDPAAPSAYPPMYAPCYGTYGTYAPAYGMYPPAYGAYGAYPPAYGTYGCGPSYPPSYPMKW